MSISSLLVRGLKRGVWVWNDATNELQFTSSIEEKKQKKHKEIKTSAAINGLTYAALKVDIKFKATVNELELMDFRHFLKKRNLRRNDSIVTIQDCKIVAIFLCMEQLPTLFHKFYNLASVNQLLRACIVYLQFYLQTCETIVKTQHFLRGNAIPSGRAPTYQVLKEDLDDLRTLIGRFYAGIIFAGMGLTNISRTDEILLVEIFLRVSTIVVWIALERKYLNEIKIELERIFRTGYFNNFNKHDSENILHLIKKENHVILDGKFAELNKKKSKAPCRLTSNSPNVQNFMHMDESKLILFGKKDLETQQDDRLTFLTKYIFLPEKEIQAEGVSIGILGLHRRLFDPLLYPCSKRILKLLITGSPMDIAEERKRLRENAIKKAQRETEPQSPHIFDDLPKIPRRNQYTEKEPPLVPQEYFERKIRIERKHEEKHKEEEEQEEDEEEEEDEDDFDYMSIREDLL